jgi:pimeloyl-ACP methyl ester carboxylesterase
MTMSPRPTHVQANGLEHRVLEWSARALPGSKAVGTSTVFLIHGFMDAAGTWDLVAPALAENGFRVLAPDMRGFGDGGRAPPGSYYHFADYIADLAELIGALSPNAPVALVGHSMGGTITTLYAGAFPENVVRLANVEGLGPPDNGFESGPTRMRTWINDLRAVGVGREPAPMRREDARRRLVTNHPGVPPDVLDRLLPHLVRDVEGREVKGLNEPDDEARVVWRFDPLHRTTSPVPFFSKLFIEFAKRVTCPVLFVSGGRTGFHPADEDERLAAFVDLRREELEGGGHMLHWARPDELASLLVGFL